VRSAPDTSHTAPPVAWMSPSGRLSTWQAQGRPPEG
jgi:hypothetical protein